MNISHLPFAEASVMSSFALYIARASGIHQSGEIVQHRKKNVHFLVPVIYSVSRCISLNVHVHQT